MTYEALKEIIANKKKGTFTQIQYEKALKTRKGVEDVIIKKTSMQCRLGCRYENLAPVKQARAEAEANGEPTKNAGLPENLEWIDENFIRNKKTGAIMLRLSYANGNKGVSEYFKNGVKVAKEDIAPLCLKSETAAHTTPMTVISINIDKITSLK